MGFPNFVTTPLIGLIDRDVRRLRSSHGLLQDFLSIKSTSCVTAGFECRKITKPGFNPNHINDRITKVKLYEKQSGAWNVSRIPQELQKLPGLLEWKNNTTINNLHVVVSSKHEPFSQLDPPYVSWTNPPILSQFWWPERWPTEFSSHFPSALTHCGAWPSPCCVQVCLRPKV